MLQADPLQFYVFLAFSAVLTAALTRLPAVPCLEYGDAAVLERQLCQFILRGLGLGEAAIATHLDRALSASPGQSAARESA
jgi:hypothetical protein